MKVKKGVNIWGNFLDQYGFTHWATFTTPYSLTLKSARRLMEALHRKLNAGPMDDVTIFWAAEPFDVKEGYHVHALLKFNWGVDYGSVQKTWRRVTAKNSRIHIEKFVTRKGAAQYVAKYITKDLADYDLLLNQNTHNVKETA